jgi:hypothetical protein
MNTVKARAQTLAPASLDRVQIIRRSSRCSLFGKIGLVPIIGTGLAIQALRLRRTVCGELGMQWLLPPVAVYWALGLATLWAVDRVLGIPGDAFAIVLLLLLQSWHLWMRVPRAPTPAWNPVRAELACGAILACAGIGSSLWLLTVVVDRLLRMTAGP